MIRMFDEQMNEVDLSKYGLMAKSLKPSSLPPEHVTDKVSGRPGLIRSGTELGSRKCEVDFRVKGSNFNIHSLYRSKLFDLFDPTIFYYIVQEEQVGKRWPVIISSEWTPERINPAASKFTVPFETYELPYAESINTSLTPQTFDTPWWQLGMGLIAENTPYTFNTSSFRVHNPGNVVINPFYCEMEITIQAICSSYIELINETTGDKWRYDGALTSSDTVKLGFKAKKNNLSIYRSTNREVITLMPGWNNFKVNGASSIQNITFAFRFYYKG